MKQSNSWTKNLFTSKMKKHGTLLCFLKKNQNSENNFVRAKAVLSKVEKSAIKDGHVNAINEAYSHMYNGGFSERVPDNEVYKPDGSVHYIQCHSVYKLDGDSTKVRIVMNESAK